MCPVERERDQSGCRASGLTPELPVHVVLVSSDAGSAVAGSGVVGSAVVGSAVVGSVVVGSAAASFSGAGSAAASSSLVPMVQRQPHRGCYFLDCPRKFRLRPLWWLQKSSGFYSCRPPHCRIDASSLIFFSGTGGIQAWTCIRRINHFEV